MTKGRVISISSAFDTRGIESGVARVESSIKNLEKTVESSKPMTSFTDSIVTGLAKITVAAAGVRSVISSITSMVVAPLVSMASAQQTQVAFEVMTGSAEKAKKLIEDLRTMGAKTPFEFAGLSQATEVLLGFGRSNDVVISDLNMLSNVAKGNQEKLMGLALVYGQISSAGKLMGQDILQLINQQFNPLDYIIKRTGESMTELKDRVSKGKVSFEEVRQAFIDATSEGGRFFQMNARMASVLIGIWNGLQDEISSVVLAIGEQIDKSFDVSGTLQGISNLASVFKEEWLPEIMHTVNWTKNLVSGYFDFQRICSTIVPVIGGVVAVMATVVAVQKAIAIGQTMVLALSGPAGWATLAAGAAIGYAAYSQLDGVFSDLAGSMAAAKTDLGKLDKAFSGAKTNDDFIKATEEQLQKLREERDRMKMSDAEYERRQQQIVDAEQKARAALAAGPAAAKPEEEKKKKDYDNTAINKKIAELNSQLGILQGTATESGNALQKMIDSGASPEKVAQLKKLMDQVEGEKKKAKEQTRLQGIADKIKEDTKTVAQQMEDSFNELQKLNQTLDKDGNPLISQDQMASAQRDKARSLLSGLIPDDDWAEFRSKKNELDELLSKGWISPEEHKKGLFQNLPNEIQEAIDASKTPIQQYQEQIEKLQKGVNEGFLSPEAMKKASEAALPESLRKAMEAAKDPNQRNQERIAELDKFAGVAGVTPEILAKAKQMESLGNEKSILAGSMEGSRAARETIVRHQMQSSGQPSKDPIRLQQEQLAIAKREEARQKRSERYLQKIAGDAGSELVVNIS